MITNHKLGGRTVELFIPVERVNSSGTLDKVVLSPILWGHSIKWRQGAYFPSVFKLLVELSGEHEETLKRLRYPDADRVQATFMEMLPNDIRQDILNGTIPQPPPAAPTPAEPQQQPEEEPASLGLELDK